MMTSPQMDPFVGRTQVRRGIAAVEFALVAPLLCMIVLGMFELSRGLMAKVTLSDAARKGCRTGILHQYGNYPPASTSPTYPNCIYNDVVNIMRDNGYDSTKFNPPMAGASGGIGTITIQCWDPNTGVHTANDETLDAPAGNYVSVQVSIPVSSVMWLTSFFLTDTMIESETVVMVKQ